MVKLPLRVCRLPPTVQKGNRVCSAVFSLGVSCIFVAVLPRPGRDGSSIVAQFSCRLVVLVKNQNALTIRPVKTRQHQSTFHSHPPLYRSLSHCLPPLSLSDCPIVNTPRWLQDVPRTKRDACVAHTLAASSSRLPLSLEVESLVSLSGGTASPRTLRAHELPHLLLRHQARPRP